MVWRCLSTFSYSACIIVKAVRCGVSVCECGNKAEACIFIMLDRLFVWFYCGYCKQSPCCTNRSFALPWEDEENTQFTSLPLFGVRPRTKCLEVISIVDDFSSFQRHHRHSIYKKRWWWWWHRGRRVCLTYDVCLNAIQPTCCQIWSKSCSQGFITQLHRVSRVELGSHQFHHLKIPHSSIQMRA